MIEKRVKKIKGMLLAPGIAIGKAFVIQKDLRTQAPRKLPKKSIPFEISKLKECVQEVQKELAFLRDEVTSQVGEEGGKLISIQLLVIQDISFIKEIEEVIQKESIPYESAIYAILRRYEEKFSKSQNAYLREKFFDVKDVLMRMSQRGYLRDRRKALKDQEHRILVCEQILPTTLLGFDKKAFDGIVTVTGGMGSHAAILARSYGIPAIGVPKGITKKISENQVIFVDGYHAEIFVNPDERRKTSYEKEILDYKDYRVRVRAKSKEACETKDGCKVKILANCGQIEDVEAAVEAGADGIGLLRTEIMFYAQSRFPNEDEQYKFYRSVIQKMDSRPITLRTLDLGGDKSLPYFLLPKQVNPYLGWRSLKVSFDHPNEFMTQIKAILRAARYGNVRMLFPMVTNYSDISLCQEYVERCCQHLRSQGSRFDEDLKLGAMIETPSAVTCLDHILPEVDFVSIGTNDLIQHILAVDRDNPKVSQFYVAHHPAVIQNLKEVFQKAGEQKYPVTVCGEMASNPNYIILLLGLGLKRFSMAPCFIPIVKDIVRHVELRRARHVAEEALQMKTSEEILRYLKRKNKEYYPSIDKVV